MGSLERLDGLIQRIYGGEARYILLSKVQFGTMWTVEIGSVGETKPRWWRSVLDADDIPKSLTPEVISGAILAGEIYLSGMTGENTSPKLKFYPSRPDIGTLHLMSYSPEESAQRAEKVLFELAGMAQKSGCRLFGSASDTAPPPASTSRAPPYAPPVPTPVTPVKSRPKIPGASMLPPSSAPTSPDKIEADAEIARLKQELSRSETTIQNLKETASFQGGPGKIGEAKRTQPAATKLLKDRSKGNAVQRKRVVERVEFESDSDDDDASKAASTSKKPTKTAAVPSSSSAMSSKSSKTVKPPPRKKRVVAPNDFESD